MTRPNSRPELRVAVISPHRDDAAFSCGAFLHRCSHTGINVTIVNIFTRSTYAPYGSETTVEEVSHLRRSEDERFLQLLGPACCMLDLGRDDAPIRLGISADRVLTPEPAAQRFDQDVMEVAQQLRPLQDFDLILLPLGIGQHVDHRVTREAGRLSFEAATVAFYEDLPYASRIDAQTRASEDRQLDLLGLPLLDPVIFHTSGAADLKVRFASVYASQIAEEVAHEIGAYASTLGGGERFYMPPVLASRVREAWMPQQTEIRVTTF